VPTIIATPGLPASNSYLTLAEANDIIVNQRLHNSAWVAANSTQKEVALIWATRIIDGAFDWYGALRSLNQGLRWPRVGMLDRDERYVDPDTIPVQLKQAVADLALALLTRDRISEPEMLGLGISSARVGPLSVTLDSKMVLSLIPSYVIDALTPWGLPYNSTGGMRVLPIVRT
jgi:hypothetical protein